MCRWLQPGGLGTAEDGRRAHCAARRSPRAGWYRIAADRRKPVPMPRTVPLKNPEFDALVTQAFSGRYARGLANSFTRLLDHVAPLLVGGPQMTET